MAQRKSKETSAKNTGSKPEEKQIESESETESLAKNQDDSNNIQPTTKYRAEPASASMGKVRGIPGVGSQGIGMNPVSNTNRLNVGKNVKLKGGVITCDILSVEGKIEASLPSASEIEIGSGGYFKGKAKVTNADISGDFEGELQVKDVLTIRKGGVVSGTVRYGKIVIESGGKISGDMQSFDSMESDR